MPKKRKPQPDASYVHRWDALALYNAECARGIVHTPEWDERMAKRQAAFDASLAVGGSGVLYPQGPRQAQTQQLLESPQGFASGGYDIDAGSAFGWPNDVEPDVAGP